MLNLIGRAFRRTGNFLIRLGRGQTPEERAEREQRERVRPWVEARGDEMLRLDYPLSRESIVVDLGGYKGQWASDIFARYQCRILVFEPVAVFCRGIEARFLGNDRIQVFAFGLGSEDAEKEISLQADSTSLFKAGDATERIELRRASDLLDALDLPSVHLMKVNIEGAEYDLLDHLIEAGWMKRIENLQVQFHPFVEDAMPRMRRIQARLAETHDPTYQYEFVWENWRLRA